MTLADEAIISESEGTIKVLGTGKILIKKNKTVENRGTIENDGEIDIDEQSNVISQGKIDNKGLFHSRGQISELNQDSIGGIVIIDSKTGFQTNVPTIQYNNLQLRGSGLKRFDNKNLRVGVTSFFSSDPNTPILYEDNQSLLTYDTVIHNGSINPGQFDKGLTGLHGNSAQRVSGTGTFRHLQLDNAAGADVVDGGGFSVSHHLELKNGELRNSEDNNFTLGGNKGVNDQDTVLISRSNGSIAYSPVVAEGAALKVSYEENNGTTQFVTGEEIPANDSIYALSVYNTAGLVMDRDVNVNDSIYIASKVTTYQGATAEDQHTLSLHSIKNPEFGNEYAEIDGSFERTVLPAGFVALFNNRHITASFNEETDKNGIEAVTMDVRPNTEFADPDKRGDTKVQRPYRISAQDADGNEVTEGFKMDVQYVWRHKPPFDSPENETFEEGMDRTEEFVMQEWLPEGRWADVDPDTQGDVEAVAGTDWLFSTITIVNTGEFGIGFPALDYLYIMANAIFEGPYRSNWGVMDTTTFTQARAELTTPPDIYPYNLDPNRENIQMNPEITGVVDWVVLEFRTEKERLLEDESGRFYKTCLLKYDGSLIDPSDGRNGVLLQEDFTQNINGVPIDTTGEGNYYIAIRHRNHLAVVTDSSFTLSRENSRKVINFNDPSVVAGWERSRDPEIWDDPLLEAAPLKVIQFANEGLGIYGIAAGYAGNLNNNERRGVIDSLDFDYVWEDMNIEGYFYAPSTVNNADYNMDGIVNTLDFNMSWNNRRRQTIVDKP